jgi:hypothetical protein
MLGSKVVMKGKIWFPKPTWGKQTIGKVVKGVIDVE